jgi:hypothetical protein
LAVFVVTTGTRLRGTSVAATTAPAVATALVPTVAQVHDQHSADQQDSKPIG